MKRFGCVLAAVAVLVCGRAFIAGQEEKAPPPKDNQEAAKEKADIDLVLCIDTSNSMDGLIGAAKQKLWDIVNTLARAKPTPNLRVALYSYGNDGYDSKKGWVRKELDFSTNLDKVFEKLFDLKTGGGTEFATRVSHDAIKEQAWSKNPKALKMIFVCGNEPANQDSVVTMKAVGDLAATNDITINTIYCGGADDSDCQSWRELARLAKGNFSNINQGQEVAIATPFDKDLAKLADAVNQTYIPYGEGGKANKDNQALQTANSAKIDVANLAARVQLQNGALYRNSDWDLVDKLKDDKNFDLGKIPEKDLRDNMKKMTPKERLEYVESMKQKRAAIQKEAQALSEKRNEYLKKELERLEPEKRASRFDAALDGIIREQAEAKKIAIPK